MATICSCVEGSWFRQESGGQIRNTTPEIALFALAAFYAICLVLNWWYCLDPRGEFQNPWAGTSRAGEGLADEFGNLRFVWLFCRGPRWTGRVDSARKGLGKGDCRGFARQSNGDV